jgi:hypothetical protein
LSEAIAQLEGMACRMKACVYINRHIVRANKKATRDTGQVVDDAAIVVRTYKGSTYCKRVEFTGVCTLVQDADAARCSGATIWIEARWEDLIIDGVPTSSRKDPCNTLGDGK